MVCLEFEWRAAFRLLVPQMAQGVKMFLEDVCSTSLQQEEMTRSSAPSLMPLGRVSFSRQDADLCPETDMPKMIAKASNIGCLKKEHIHVPTCYSMLVMGLQPRHTDPSEIVKSVMLRDVIAMLA